MGITEYIVIEQQESRLNVCKTNFAFNGIIQLSINLIRKKVFHIISSVHIIHFLCLPLANHKISFKLDFTQNFTELI